MPKTSTKHRPSTNVGGTLTIFPMLTQTPLPPAPTVEFERSDSGALRSDWAHVGCDLHSAMNELRKEPNGSRTNEAAG